MHKSETCPECGNKHVSWDVDPDADGRDFFFCDKCHATWHPDTNMTRDEFRGHMKSSGYMTTEAAKRSLKKRSIKEALEVLVVSGEPNSDIVTDNMVSEWGNVPYAQLSVVLVWLRFLSLVHQTHHWTAKGDSFFGDHLLFERIYGSVSGEVDSVAEKAIGLGATSNVDMVLQTTQLMQLVQGYGMTQTIPQPTELAKRSLQAETNFVKVMGFLINQMKEAGVYTVGLENLIGGIVDTHEGHIYLLKQRCTPGA